MAKQKFSDIELLSALTEHDNNITKTAEALGVSRTAIIKRKRELPEGALDPDIESFRAKRANILASIQRMLLMQLTPKKIGRASLNQIGTLFGILYDKERLEKNLATEYIAHAHFKALSPDQMKAINRVSREMTEQKLKNVTYKDDDDN